MPEGNNRPIALTRVSPPGAEPSRLLAPPVRHFYRTSSSACPYIAGRLERKIVTDLSGRDANPIYSTLSRAGFRRSHHLAYRPACPGCQACVPVRVVVGEFVEGKSMRRVRAANEGLIVGAALPVATAEQYRLFHRYQRSRHTDSDMASMTFGDYRSMIEDTPVMTRVIELRDREGELAAACLVDLLDDGISAVYSFFETQNARRSLGTFLVLTLIDEARRRGLPYVYLGYWVANSPKMSYKLRFRPLEFLEQSGWRPIAG